MSRHTVVSSACTLAWLFLLGAAAPPAGGADAGAVLPERRDPPGPGDGDQQIGDEAGSDPEDEGLRQRLTEREDRRRPAEPWFVELGGRPLTVSGEYELRSGALRRRVLAEPVEEPDRLLLEQTLEAEVFYSYGPELSLFAQLVVEMEEDLLSDTFEDVSDLYVERGEMWIYSEDIAGTHLNLDVGRLDFEDERRFWWDDELDALRLAYETDRFELALALAREIAAHRSDRREVDAERERLVRLIGELSFDWGDEHALELFLLRQSDHSRRERPGQVVRSAREDESDARLTWLGARVLGVFELAGGGILGYWLDTAAVRGEERFAEFEELAGGRSVVDEVRRRDVRGWAVDAGLSLILPLPLEPRVFAGYAYGSGDARPDTGSDRSFRQTGLQANEAGFGGVERFAHYGIVLDPELSNLGVATLGVGLALLRSSSLDLVYHRYRLAEPATSLRDARLELELDGERRRLGDALDLVLAIEEWQRLELELVLAAFRAGRAFGRRRGTWSVGGSLSVRFAF